MIAEMPKKDRKLRIEEVAFLVGVSTQTINNWYRWKKLNPKHEMAKLLPDYVQEGARQVRYWKSGDIWTLQQFKSSIPHGKLGILGEVTQKYLKTRKEN